MAYVDSTHYDNAESTRLKFHIRKHDSSILVIKKHTWHEVSD